MTLHHSSLSLMLILRGCSWVSMQRGGCKSGNTPLSKKKKGGRGGGAVVSQLVPNFKESVPLPGFISGPYSDLILFPFYFHHVSRRHLRK